MKITLTQVEIELAIRNHIANTIPVPEDADLEIQFEDGEYSAVIDLNPSEEDKAVKAEVKATAKRTYNRRPKTDPVAATPAHGSEPTPATPEAPANVPVAAAQQPAGDETTTTSGDEPASEENPAQDQTTGTTDGAPRTSLFSGLARPKND